MTPARLLRARSACIVETRRNASVAADARNSAHIAALKRWRRPRAQHRDDRQPGAAASRAPGGVDPQPMSVRAALRGRAANFIAALRRKIELWRHLERLATPDKTR